MLSTALSKLIMLVNVQTSVNGGRAYPFGIHHPEPQRDYVLDHDQDPRDPFQDDQQQHTLVAKPCQKHQNHANMPSIHGISCNPRTRYCLAVKTHIFPFFVICCTLVDLTVNLHRFLSSSLESPETAASFVSFFA